MEAHSREVYRDIKFKIIPYFGLFGDNSYFTTMKEALGYGQSYINSVETGLSADPFMIRSISELNRVSIISNSDSYSTISIE